MVDFKTLKEEASLADKFIATTYTLPKKLFHGKGRKHAEMVMLEYRQAMRHSHKFVLDDEFVRWATIMATAQAERTLARLQYATLPYATTWIEFNLHAKVKTIRKIHRANVKSMDGVPKRLGCLIERISFTESVCTLISEIVDKDGDSVSPHMTSYFFSTAERHPLELKRYHGCTPMLADKPRASLWGYTLDRPSEIYDSAGMAGLTTPKFLELHGDAGFSRMFELYRALIQANNGGQKSLDAERAIATSIESELIEFTGHMRWLVTVLAMLNEVPIRTDHITPSYEMRVDHTRKKQLVDYHRVTLRLPKIHPQPFIERHLAGSDRRHRAHEVRTHWRTYLHKAHCTSETHEWEYDHENGYRLCTKCMAYSRRIDEHIRGDPELGWVRKDYFIKKEEF